MDGQAKLTRKHSSLLRSSPTVRSTIHSLSSMADLDLDLDDLEDQKPHHHQHQHHHRRASPPSPDSSPPTRCRPPPLPPSPFSSPYSLLRLIPFLAVASASLFASFAYLQTSEISTSENLLLALTFLAVALFFAGRNRHSIEKSISLLKHLYLHSSTNLTRFASSHTPPHHRSRRSRSSVRWYIDPTAAACDDYPKSKLENSRFSSSLSFPVSASARPNRRAGRVGEEEEGAVEVYANGDYYEGEFYKGKSNGSGVYTYFVNGKYEGDWVDGKYDGFGIESWAKGSRYRGQYRHGLRHGYGVYRFYTGDSYAGEWYKGQYHGVGVQRCSDGSCFVGEFKFGAKHGRGCYHFRNGDRYAGEYFGDKIHGFGVYHFANGHCYEGSWHEGRKQGYGMYKFRSGDSKCGEWDCGSLKTSLPPLTDAVIRAVQAARKTAENAINLRQVDEQVKKAVMAANRAATAARVAAVKAVQNRMEEKHCDLDW